MNEEIIELIGLKNTSDIKIVIIQDDENNEQFFIVYEQEQNIYIVDLKRRFYQKVVDGIPELVLSEYIDGITS